MSRRRRLSLEAPDGRVVVTDLSRPGARLLEISLPDGRSVMVAEHLCGWAGTDDPEAGEPLWATVAEAVEALSGRLRDGEPWISVLEEFATGLGRPAGAALPPDEERRLAALPRRRASVYVDGPRAHDTGGWYVFVGGLPGDAWVLELGETPLDAARGALARAEELLADG